VIPFVEDAGKGQGSHRFSTRTATTQLFEEFATHQVPIDLQKRIVEAGVYQMADLIYLKDFEEDMKDFSLSVDTSVLRPYSLSDISAVYSGWFRTSDHHTIEA
jgi:hypothetical protein